MLFANKSILFYEACSCFAYRWSFVERRRSLIVARCWKCWKLFTVWLKGSHAGTLSSYSYSFRSADMGSGSSFSAIALGQQSNNLMWHSSSLLEHHFSIQHCLFSDWKKKKNTPQMFFFLPNRRVLALSINFPKRFSSETSANWEPPASLLSLMKVLIESGDSPEKG